jgi:hypothetical protein
VLLERLMLLALLEPQALLQVPLALLKEQLGRMTQRLLALPV